MRRTRKEGVVIRLPLGNGAVLKYDHKVEALLCKKLLRLLTGGVGAPYSSAKQPWRCSLYWTLPSRSFLTCIVGASAWWEGSEFLFLPL